jgi:type IV secretory pathway VirB6-like protein
MQLSTIDSTRINLLGLFDMARSSKFIHNLNFLFICSSGRSLSSLSRPRGICGIGWTISIFIAISGSLSLVLSAIAMVVIRVTIIKVLLSIVFSIFAFCACFIFVVMSFGFGGFSGCLSMSGSLNMGVRGLTS